MKWWTWKGKKECVIYGKAGESRTQFKNISSHASSCGMSRTPRFSLRNGIFSSFLFFFFLFFFLLFPSFPFVTLIQITFANHIYNICANRNGKWDQKIANDFLVDGFLEYLVEIFTLREKRFHPSWTDDASTYKFSSRSRTRDKLYFFLFIFNFKLHRFK